MSFGLGHGRPLDPAPGVVLLSDDELGPLPDVALTNPAAGLIDPLSWFRRDQTPSVEQPSQAGAETSASASGRNEPARLELEIGCGKGTFLIEHAARHPRVGLLGIEWAREFAYYTADRVRRRREAAGELLNIRVANTDATQLLRWRTPPASFAIIHLYFSDPWPKKRHHKKRVVQHTFLADCWKALTPGGELRVVTDHDELWAWDERHFEAWCLPQGWQLLQEHLRPTDHGLVTPIDGRAPFERKAFAAGPQAGEGELVGSNFERKFRLEGRGFHAAVLRRTP